MIIYDERKVVKLRDVDTFTKTITLIDSQHRQHVVVRNDFDKFMSEITNALEREIYEELLRS